MAPLVARTLDGAPGKLGVILLTPENGERVEALATAMQSIGRLLVLDPDGLALATAALGRPLDVPYGVYVPSTMARQFAQDDAGLALNIPRVATDSMPVRVTAAEIAADTGRFLLRLDWPHIADLLDLVPRGAGGVLFHGQWRAPGTIRSCMAATGVVGPSTEPAVCPRGQQRSRHSRGPDGYRPSERRAVCDVSALPASRTTGDWRQPIDPAHAWQDLRSGSPYQCLTLHRRRRRCHVPCR